MKKIININRRSFLKTTTAASAMAGFNILPSFGASPNEKLNVALIGCMGQGRTIGNKIRKFENVNIVALCDVDPSRAAEIKKDCPNAKVYADFRKMFDEMGDMIDACTVGTPDHSHFPITMRALAENIAVYVEKPLAHSFQECELLATAEKKYKGVCQMGNQGHSTAQRVQFQTWVESGLIKNVSRVDAWMNGGRRWHPWGDVTSLPAKDEMPENMHWDVWAGTAPKHPFSRKFDGGNWRGWHDYGNGAFGDWGPHLLDSVHRFLKLGLPYEIRADKLEGQNDFIYPMASMIAFEIAERGEGMPAMSLNWYDGVENTPPRPEELEEGREIPNFGKFIYSDDLTFMGGAKASRLEIIPETKHRDMKDEMPDLPKADTSGDHMQNFVNAAMGKEECNSKFEVSAPLTQVFTLGCISQRLGGTLKFDTKTKQITNNKRANELLNPPPRKGWEEYYKI